ncbi:caspase family protein [Streptomyces sp. NK08204]|uniref:caspase, EACC1-associated type n=1 Tax=Streptomyces sp. NK08204 TaxID=2873260 RepID=UPI001CEC793A|nr:caspase family protein [Streptomyces sp. NK08204]
MTGLSGSGVRILLLGTATHPGPTLTSVPAVARTVEALQERLVARCGVPTGQIRTIIDPGTAQEMATAIAEEARQAETAFLLYYVGHGLIGPADKLYLAASSTDRLTPGLAAHQALSLSAVREALTACRASCVIVVLDCCFSGRAQLGGGRTPPPSLALPAAHGMYLMGSAEQLALAPQDAPHTVFSGELIRLLDEGDPRGPRLLTLDAVYDYLFRALRARGGPLPRRQVGDRSGDLVIAVNPAQAAVTGPEEEEPDPASGPCPYLGLESFTVDDAELFHGRARLVSEVVAASAKSVENGRPLIVVGPSGSGKTSLLHAGLLAGLRRGAPQLPGSSGWPWAVLTPGEHPVRSLAAALHPDGVEGSESLLADPASAVALVASLLEGRPEGRLVLVVDQVEELLTVCRSERERAAFLEALTAVAESGPGRGALVVMALRADFYGEAQAVPELAAALRDNQVLAAPMSLEQLRDAIEQPAAIAGLSLDDGLVDLLLHELGAAHLPGPQAGTLPLLSHTLWATWRQRSGTRLTVAGYRDSGGITRAIANTADETYAKLDEAGKNAVRRMMPRLVRIGDDTVDTARPTDRTALLDGLPDPHTAEQALHRFAEARLLVLDKHTVRISHDALLRAWPLLRQWIDADRDWLRARQQIAADADAWWHADRDQSLLYRGTRLAAAQASAENASRAVSDTDPRLAAFLAESRRAEHRAARRRTAVLATLVVLCLLAVSGGALAAVYQVQAATQRTHAVARLVAAEADRLRDTDPGLAKQLSIVAYRMDPGTNTAPLLANLETPGVYDGPETVFDIAQSRDGGTLALSTGPGIALWDVNGHAKGRIGLPGAGPVVMSPNGRLLVASATSNGPRRATVGLWNVTDPTRPVAVPVPPRESTGVTSLAFSPDNHLLALGTATGAIHLWDMSNPAAPHPLRDLTGHTAQVDSLAFSSSGTALASSAADHHVRLWNFSDPSRPALASVLDGAPIGQDLSATPMRRVSFRPDGDVLAAPGDGNASGLRLWNVRDLAHPALLTAQDDSLDDCRQGLVSSAFSPDGKTLATECKDQLYLWEVDNPSHIQEVNDLEEPEPTFAGGGTAIFGPHGNQLLHATTRGVHLWDVDNAPQLGAASTFGGSPSGFLVAAQFSGGPRRLMAVQGASDGALWDLTGPTRHHKLADLPGSGNIGAAAAAFSPDGGILATSDLDGDRIVLHLRSTRHPRSAPLATVSSFANGVGALAYSPDGRVLAATDNMSNARQPAPPAVKLFDVTDPHHPRQIASMPGNVFHLAFAPHGHLLVGNTADTLLLWNVSDPHHPVAQPTRRLTRGSAVSESAFRPDGKLLAVTDSADTTRLWHVDHDRLEGDPTVVRTVGSGSGIAFDPDGRTLALTSSGNLNTYTGQVNGHIELWDVTDADTPAFRAGFAYHGMALGGGELSYSTQGKPLLVSTSRTVDVWNTDPDAAVRQLCLSIGDTITRNQWSKYVPNTDYQPPCPTSW